MSAWLCACLIILIIAQDDAWVKKKIAQQCSRFYSDNFDCSFSADIDYINFFTGRIDLKNLEAKSLNGVVWSWSAQHVVVELSWLYLFLRNNCAIAFTVDNLSVTSDIQGTSIGIFEHIKNLLKAPAKPPFMLKSCVITSGTCTVHDISDAYSGILHFSTYVDFTSAGSIACMLNGGCVYVGSGCIFKKCSGEITYSGSKLYCAIKGIHAQHSRVDDYWYGEVSVDDGAISAACHNLTHKITLLGTSLMSVVNGTCQWMRNNMLEYEGSFVVDLLTGKATHDGKLLQPCIDLSTQMQIYDGRVTACAHYDNYHMDIDAQLYPRPHVVACTLYNNKNTCCTFQGDNTCMGVCSIPFTVLRNYMQIAGITLPSRGALTINVDYQALPHIRLRVSCDPFFITGASVGTKISGLRARVLLDGGSSCIVVQDASCALPHGVIKIPRALIDYSVSGIEYAYCPLLLQKCCFHWNKNIFAVCSGSLLFTYDRHKKSTFDGTLVIDKSRICNVPFTTQKELKKTTTFIDDVLLNILIKTGQLAQIKLPFVEAQAYGCMHCHGTFGKPELSGVIALHQGVVAFPYEPLVIQKGKIYCMPNNELMLDIAASSSVKQYKINMDISGTLSDPVIKLDAQPALSESHIVALLLGGVADGSLAFAVPRGVTRYLEDFIFAPQGKAYAAQAYIKSFLPPVKNIRIVPSLTDHTGRGGLRARLEIDVNDRLKALIQKNFSLTEDVYVEVDYAISDDVAVHAMKDERGDIGAEIEMKWKF
jgi:hypothetical protein